MGIPYLEFDSSCYQKNPKAELIAAAIKNVCKWTAAINLGK
jgi:hypothetical protein